MKRLIYSKNGQSLDFLVLPLNLSSHDFVDHVAHGLKKKETKCQAIGVQSTTQKTKYRATPIPLKTAG